MKQLKKILVLPLTAIIIISLFAIFSTSRNLPAGQRGSKTSSIIESNFPASQTSAQQQRIVDKLKPPDISFAGPRQNIPENTPSAYGFWSFAIPMPNIISRSGQPTITEFDWLKKEGVKSIVDLRVDGEYGETGDDSRLTGFNDLKFNYLYLPMKDGSPPTDEQAKRFLAFAANPANRPLHIHCRGGYGRTGTLVALYRFAFQSWPINEAIKESRLFRSGISARQKNWLFEWAKNHSTV
jgi:protein-tyrosine phosphatase